MTGAAVYHLTHFSFQYKTCSIFCGCWHLDLNARFRDFAMMQCGQTNLVFGLVHFKPTNRFIKLILSILLKSGQIDGFKTVTI